MCNFWVDKINKKAYNKDKKREREKTKMKTREELKKTIAEMESSNGVLYNSDKVRKLKYELASYDEKEKEYLSFSKYMNLPE